MRTVASQGRRLYPGVVGRPRIVDDAAGAVLAVGHEVAVHPQDHAGVVVPEPLSADAIAGIARVEIIQAGRSTRRTVTAGSGTTY